MFNQFDVVTVRESVINWMSIVKKSEYFLNIGFRGKVLKKVDDNGKLIHLRGFSAIFLHEN